MNVIKTSLMGLTAAAVLGMASMAVAAPAVDASAVQTKPAKAHKQRPQLTEAQKNEIAQRQFDRRYGYLDLSKSQQNKIKAIEAQYRPAAPEPTNLESQREANQQRREAARAERLQLVQAKSFNEAAAQNLLQQERTARETAAAAFQQRFEAQQLQNLKKEHAIYQVLNKKQQQAYLERSNRPHMMRTHAQRVPQHGAMPRRDAKAAAAQ